MNVESRSKICARLCPLVTFFCILAVSHAHAVVCDKFEIKTTLHNSTLELSVDTDLPEDTVVFVNVGRVYLEKGNPDEYSVDYFDEKNTIGKWKSQHAIPIDNKKWKADLRAKQRRLDKLSLGFDVESISKNITVSMIVPIRQPNPEFGKRNSKLAGKAVIIGESIRNVHGEAEIEYPLNESDIEKNLPSLHPLTLSVSHTYILSKRTPLMTTHDPGASRAEIMKTKQIYIGGMIRILKSVINAEENRWYKVEAMDSDGDLIGKGWVNSIALMRQDLELRK